MSQPIVVIGAGGFGREVVDVVDAINAGSPDEQFEVIGFLDDGDPDLAPLAHFPDVIGAVIDLETLPENVGYVIGIGSPRVRRKIDLWAHSLGRTSPILVHPSAQVGRSVSIGPGVVVCANVSITNNIRIGRHVHVNLSCTIGHDAVLDDYVTLSPLVAVSGYVRIAEAVMVGTGATLNPQINVGAEAVLGSGAVALKDVPAGATAVGVPAKVRLV